METSSANKPQSTNPLYASKPTGATQGESIPQANELVDRVAQGAHDTIDRVAESAAPHLQRLQQGLSEANQTLHERADQARQRGGEWRDELRGTVRQHPVAAVAAALAVGALIGRVMR